MGITNDRNDPGLKNIGRDGMQETYLVLSDEERAKGFVRPLRLSYVHVGIAGPKYPLVDLSPEDAERYEEWVVQHVEGTKVPSIAGWVNVGYVKFEKYPPDPDSSSVGRYWTQQQLDSIGRGCGAVTRMGQAIAETYSRNPRFYGGTFCVGCGDHFPVGEDGEFVWEGTEERVGT